MRFQKTQQKVFKVVHFFLYSPVNIGETAGKPKICGYSKLCSQVLEAYTSLPGQTSNRVINSPASCSFLSGTYIQENSYPLWPTFIRMLQLLDLLPLTKNSASRILATQRVYSSSFLLNTPAKQSCSMPVGEVLVNSPSPMRRLMQLYWPSNY